MEVSWDLLLIIDKYWLYALLASLLVYGVGHKMFGFSLVVTSLVILAQSLINTILYQVLIDLPQQLINLLWHLSWGLTDLFLLSLILMKCSFSRRYRSYDVSIMVFSFIAMCVNFSRFIEVNVTSTSYIKPFYGAAILGVNAAILFTLYSPMIALAVKSVYRTVKTWRGRDATVSH